MLRLPTAPIALAGVALAASAYGDPPLPQLPPPQPQRTAARAPAPKRAQTQGPIAYSRLWHPSVRASYEHNLPRLPEARYDSAGLGASNAIQVSEAHTLTVSADAYLTAIGLGPEKTSPNIQQQRALLLSVANGLV